MINTARGSSTRPTRPAAAHLAAHLAEHLPAVGVGAAGCLVAARIDPDSLAFLDLLDPMPDGGLAWRREPASGLLVLSWRPLGVEVAAGDPQGLMEAVEFVADRADVLLPTAQAWREAHPSDDPDDPGGLAGVLAARLRRDLAGALAARPPGCRFRAAPLSAVAPAPPAACIVRPEVEDHRAVIPLRRPMAAAGVG